MLGLVWDINVKKGTDRPGLVIFPPLPGRYSPGRPSSPRPTRPPARPPENAVGPPALPGRVAGFDPYVTGPADPPGRPEMPSA